jgi:hypothetical protein
MRDTGSYVSSDNFTVTANSQCVGKGGVRAINRSVMSAAQQEPVAAPIVVSPYDLAARIDSVRKRQGCSRVIHERVVTVTQQKPVRSSCAARRCTCKTVVAYDLTTYVDSKSFTANSSWEIDSLKVSVAPDKAVSHAVCPT